MELLPRYPLVAAALIGAIFSVSALASEDGVELTAEMVMGGKGGDTLEVTFKMQGGYMRTDMEGASTIINSQTGEIVSVLHDQKMYVLLPAPATETHEESPSDPGAFKRTGRKETISGFACEEFVDEQEGVAVWLTRDAKVQGDIFGRLAKVGGPQNPLREFFLKASGFEGVPIRINSTDPAEPFTMTVKKLRAATFPASEFAPPSGYQPLPLPPEIGDMFRKLQE